MTTTPTETVARVVLTPILVVAAAVLVKGHSGVGDGFSAGMIAALGLLLQYLVLGRERTEQLLGLGRIAALAPAALLAALALAFGPLAFGAPPLTGAPPAGADYVELGKLSLVTAVAFDAAVFLLVVGATVGIVRAIAVAREGGES